MFGKMIIAAMVLGTAGIAAADTGVNAGKVSRTDRVVYVAVGSARTVIPVHVERAADAVARPYALTGRVESRRMVPIYVGPRLVGMREMSNAGN